MSYQDIDELLDQHIAALERELKRLKKARNARRAKALSDYYFRRNPTYG